MLEGHRMGVAMNGGQTWGKGTAYGEGGQSGSWGKGAGKANGKSDKQTADDKPKESRTCPWGDCKAARGKKATWGGKPTCF